jgi:proteasome activator subunit 4
VAYWYASAKLSLLFLDLYVGPVSLAKIIVYSMAPDGIPVPASKTATPTFSPLPSGMNTPRPENPVSSIGDYLGSSLSKRAYVPQKTYLAGSKALDSFARLIASTESFFHPSNSGTWTQDVSLPSNELTCGY